MIFYKKYVEVDFEELINVANKIGDEKTKKFVLKTYLFVQNGNFEQALDLTKVAPTEYQSYVDVRIANILYEIARMDAKFYIS